MSDQRADSNFLDASVVQALAEAGRHLEQAGGSLRRLAEALTHPQAAPATRDIAEGALEEDQASTGRCAWCGTSFDTPEALFDHLGAGDGTSPCREGISGTGG